MYHNYCYLTTKISREKCKLLWQKKGKKHLNSSLKWKHWFGFSPPCWACWVLQQAFIATISHSIYCMTNLSLTCIPPDLMTESELNWSNWELCPVLMHWTIIDVWRVQEATVHAKYLPPCQRDSFWFFLCF